MARRYDSRTTIFSPEGRLYQVEYAMESVNVCPRYLKVSGPAADEPQHAGCVVGILAPGPSGAKDMQKAEKKESAAAVIEGAQDATMADAATEPAPKAADEKPIRAGVVLAAEKRVTSKLVDKEASGGREKILNVNRNIVAGVAGITADANSLISYARNAAQSHLASFDEDMPVEQLVKRVCDLKQGYTQYGGLRPFGVSFLFAGHDPHYQFQLYSSDPSGNYSGWKAACIGSNNSTSNALLRQDYKDDIGLDAALELAVKVMSKTMDSTTLDSEKVELATLTIDSQTKLPVAHILSAREVDTLLEKCGVAKKPEETLPRV